MPSVTPVTVRHGGSCVSKQWPQSRDHFRRLSFRQLCMSFLLAVDYALPSAIGSFHIWGLYLTAGEIGCSFVRRLLVIWYCNVPRHS